MKKTNKKIKIIISFLSLLLAVFLNLILFQQIEAGNGALLISPSSDTFIIGKSFQVQVQVDTAGVPINAATVTIYFPEDKLEVLDISKENSIFSLWTEKPSFSNSAGEISFSGGLPHPGFTGTGNLITINFKSKNKGTFKINLGEGQVLADDGKATNILSILKEGKYLIKEERLTSEKKESARGEIPSSPEVFSPTHPQEEEWYSNNYASFGWEVGDDITGASFIFNKTPDSIPDVISEGKMNSKIYWDIEDGVWYFHLRVVNETGWGKTSHYKIQVDTKTPESPNILIDNQGDSTNPNPNLYLETKDNTSGVSHYQVRIGEERFSDLTTAKVNPFPLSALSPGIHSIVVRAADRAGNNIESGTELEIEPIESPKVTVWPKKYISGEEIFYIEGVSLPEVEVSIFLEKGSETIKKWKTTSNEKGEWFFSTKELFEPGTYYLSAKAQDERGAVSDFSEKREIKISLSGISLGPLIISFKTIILILISLVLLGIVVITYFIYRTKKEKEILRKETKEVRETLADSLADLKKEIEQKIEMFDSQPGFSEKERRVYESLKKVLERTESKVNKEIEDIERELG